MPASPERRQLVLSLFPGIGMLDRGFEAEGFCIVRGPDLLWGGDVRQFHPPAGRFDGVIGGPPCQSHSSMAAICHSRGIQVKPDLLPEFLRCIRSARPAWFLIENTPRIPMPRMRGYMIQKFIINARSLGMRQNRRRAIIIGYRGRKSLDLMSHLPCREADQPWAYCVLASGIPMPGREHRKGRDGRIYLDYRRGWTALRRACHLQGLPSNFANHMPFTLEGAFRAIGNGVPVPVARALAHALKIALKEARDA